MSKGNIELLEAIAFAAAKHRNQRRKDAEASPYINHPLQLAHVLATEGGVTDLKTLMAAVLHDTVEDTQTTNEELVQRFGKKVADVVMEVTDDKTLTKAERKQRQVEHASQMSKRAALVKLADKTCNLRDVIDSPPTGWPPARKREYFDWAKQVVDGLPRVNDKLLAASKPPLPGGPEAGR
jgi:guanosine-3',5'-bis(diphosphate) 3'-pyrophosphohydrolase